MTDGGAANAAAAAAASAAAVAAAMELDLAAALLSSASAASPTADPAHTSGGGVSASQLDSGDFGADSIPPPKKRRRSNRKDKGLEAFKAALLQHLADNARLTPAASVAPAQPAHSHYAAEAASGSGSLMHSPSHLPHSASQHGEDDSVANHAATSNSSAHSTPGSGPGAHSGAAGGAAEAIVAGGTVSDSQRAQWLEEYSASIADYSIKSLVKESVKYRFPCHPFVILVPNWHALREALWVHLKSIGVKKAKRSVSTKKDLVDICIQAAVQFDFSEFVKDAESHGNRKMKKTKKKEKTGTDAGAAAAGELAMHQSLGLGMNGPQHSSTLSLQQLLQQAGESGHVKKKGSASARRQQQQQQQHQHPTPEDTPDSMQPLHSPSVSGIVGASASAATVAASSSAAQQAHHHSHVGSFVQKSEQQYHSFASTAAAAHHNASANATSARSGAGAASSSPYHGSTANDVVAHLLSLSPQEYQSFKAWFYVQVVQKENPALHITLSASSSAPPQLPPIAHSQHAQQHAQGGQHQHNQHSHAHDHQQHHPPQQSSPISHAHALHHHHSSLHSMPPTPMLSSTLMPPLTPSHFPLLPNDPASHAHEHAGQSNNPAQTPQFTHNHWSSGGGGGGAANVAAGLLTPLATPMHHPHSGAASKQNAGVPASPLHMHHLSALASPSPSNHAHFLAAAAAAAGVADPSQIASSTAAAAHMAAQQAQHLSSQAEKAEQELRRKRQQLEKLQSKSAARKSAATHSHGTRGAGTKRPASGPAEGDGADDSDDSGSDDEDEDDDEEEEDDSDSEDEAGGGGGGGGAAAAAAPGAGGAPSAEARQRALLNGAHSGASASGAGATHSLHTHHTNGNGLTPLSAHSPLLAHHPSFSPITKRTINLSALHSQQHPSMPPTLPQLQSQQQPHPPSASPPSPAVSYTLPSGSAGQVQSPSLRALMSVVGSASAAAGLSFSSPHMSPARGGILSTHALASSSGPSSAHGHGHAHSHSGMMSSFEADLNGGAALLTPLASPTRVGHAGSLARSGGGGGSGAHNKAAHHSMLPPPAKQALHKQMQAE